MRLLNCYFSGLHLHAVYLSLSRHGLHSMSECLSRIISSSFTVSVDKHFDARECGARLSHARHKSVVQS